MSFSLRKWSIVILSVILASSLFHDQFRAQEPAAPAQATTIEKPYRHGQYLVLTCHRRQGAGKWPISYSEHEVTAINGKPVEKPFTAHVTYLDGFDIGGNNEVVISGYFTLKEIGLPVWPGDSPEAKYMDYTMQPFHFQDWFTATGVHAPTAAKKRFQEEVIAKRIEARN